MNVKMLAVLFLLFNSFSLWALDFEELKFEYAPTDGAASSCLYESLEDRPYDIVVKCAFFSQVKEFMVHLIVRKYSFTKAPTDRYEILYWVTNRIPGAKVPEFTGSTIWFNFIEETIPHSLKLTQHVDNSFANLTVEIKLKK